MGHVTLSLLFYHSISDSACYVNKKDLINCKCVSNDYINFGGKLLNEKHLKLNGGGGGGGGIEDKGNAEVIVSLIMKFIMADPSQCILSNI